MSNPLVKPTESKEEGLLELPEWAKWKGPGTMPKYWFAINPETKESTKVYRSYEDYVMD